MSKVPIIDLDALTGQELNDVGCAAYKMGCEQTREVYQKRIEKLEAALRTIYDCCDETGNCSVVRRIARKALEGKDDR